MDLILGPLAHQPFPRNQMGDKRGNSLEQILSPTLSQRNSLSSSPVTYHSSSLHVYYLTKVTVVYFLRVRRGTSQHSRVTPTPEEEYVATQDA